MLPGVYPRKTGGEGTFEFSSSFDDKMYLFVPVCFYFCVRNFKKSFSLITKFRVTWIQIQLKSENINF